MRFRSLLVPACALIFALAALPAQAEDLCEACRKLPQTKDMATCKTCGGMTNSGSFHHCMGCAERTMTCQRCEADLAPAEPAKALETPGTHTRRRWTYVRTVTNEGTRSEGHHGELSFAGQALPEPGLNDWVATPWGRLYWVGRPAVLFGGHGWMPRPKPSQPLGKKVVPPLPAQVPAK